MTLATKTDAAAKAKPTRKPELKRILAEHGVELLADINIVRRPRQTHAGSTLSAILCKFGEKHLRDVLLSILESEGNEHALTRAVLNAVSAVHIRHRAWFERDASRWLEVFDRVDLAALGSFAARHRVTTNIADAIGTALALELAAAFDPTLTRWRGDHLKIPSAVSSSGIT